MALLRHALAAAALLLLAGCGGPSAPPPPPPQTFSTAAPAELRKEFVILRELVKQHAAQDTAGNEARVETVERHLRARLDALPDGGRNEEEREIVRKVRAVVGECWRGWGQPS